MTRPAEPARMQRDTACPSPHAHSYRPETCPPILANQSENGAQSWPHGRRDGSKRVTPVWLNSSDGENSYIQTDHAALWMRCLSGEYCENRDSDKLPAS